MAKSLLAHLYSHIRGSQEDVATLSLQYIISQSAELKSGFNRLIGKKLNVDLSNVVKYSCQATGENLERPDISGSDAEGNEVILCEAKFYAGLTDNQPIAYLNRLKEENGKGLIFVCPNARKTSLWSKLVELCETQEVNTIDTDCVLVNGVVMSIITWSEIITELHQIAAASVPEALSDINQLDGYCKEMDMAAFIPFTSEELGSITARKQRRYTDVIIKTTELIHSDKKYKTSKATRGSYNGGFEYKMDVEDYRIHIAYDENLWMNLDSKETPFWLLIKSNDGGQDKKIMKLLQSLPENLIDDGVWNLTYIALEPMTNATLDDVAENLQKQVYKYLAYLLEEN